MTAHMLWPHRLLTRRSLAWVGAVLSCGCQAARPAHESWPVNPPRSISEAHADGTSGLQIRGEAICGGGSAPLSP